MGCEQNGRNGLRSGVLESLPEWMRLSISEGRAILTTWQRPASICESDKAGAGASDCATITVTLSEGAPCGLAMY
ncbi:hypothetical protein EHLJMEHL_05063 [Vreelandella titanicae]